MITEQWRRALVLSCLCGAMVSAAEVREYTFPAADGRLETGLFIERGQTVKVRSRGSWSMWAGRLGRSSAAGHGFRAGQYPWGQLMARVGSGAEIAVGSNREWRAGSSGELVLYPNTAELGLKAGEGELLLSIEGGEPVQQVIERLARRGHQITVPAETNGMVTDLYVTAGQEIRIDAFGHWRMYEGGPLVTADGDTQRLIGDTRTAWGRLVLRVGGPDFAVGPVFDVGLSATIRPQRSGLLELAPFVADYAGHPRTGQVTVVVRGARRASAAEVAEAARQARSYERTMALLRIHQYRDRAGLLPVFSAPELMRAAQAHAEYLAANGGDGSQQDEGSPGFVATTLERRVALSGFAGGQPREAVHAVTSGVAAVDALWDGVLTREVLAGHQAQAIGCGLAVGQRTAFVIISAVPETLQLPLAPVAPVITVPTHKQVALPFQWRGLERPSVLPQDAELPVGYPLTVVVPQARIQRVEVAELADLRGRLQHIWVFTAPETAGGVRSSSVYLVPKQPLMPVTTYRCRVRLATDQGEQSHEWEFTTAQELGVRLTPPVVGGPMMPKVDLGEQTAFGP